MEIDFLGFQPGTNRDVAVSLFETNNGKTNGTITFSVAKVSGWVITVPGITLSGTNQSGTSGTSNVNGGVLNENGNWLFRETPGFIIITSKPGIAIPASGKAVIGFNVARKPGIANGTVQNISTVISNGSGGETRISNNQFISNISAIQ
jgi:hypothetical protein